jgi:hypothetical protein
MHADSPTNKVCLGTRVNPCCPTANFSLGNLVSSTKVSIDGEDVTVTYYLTEDPTAGIATDMSLHINYSY